MSEIAKNRGIGGSSGHSDETKAKISQSHKRLNKTISEDHREKMVRGLRSDDNRKRQSDFMKVRHAEMSEEEKSLSLSKRKATNASRYGSENPMQNDGVKMRQRLSHLERNGYEYPMQSQEAKDKARQTSLERYGHEHHAMRECERQRQRDRVGDMSEVRKGFRDKYGVGNPFEINDFQEKAKQTMMSRYGVERALSDPEIVARIREHTRNTYGREWVNQDHLSDYAIEVLSDPDTLKYEFNQVGAVNLAKKLGVNNTTIYRYCAIHNIETKSPSSRYEVNVSAILSDHGVSHERGNRALLGGLEIDIFVPDIKLGIEICGLYWHGEFGPATRGRTYHLNKLNRCIENGVRLITIFEDELVHKPDIVESRLLNVLGLSARGPAARKLTIREIDSKTAHAFFERHHIQGGGVRGFVAYGAFDGETLVAAMNFGKPRAALGRKSGYPEMLRFATDGRSYAGVASRLFRRFVKEHEPDGVLSYADRRWSEGRLYREIGFELDGMTDPGYSYFHPNEVRRHHRYKFRKSEIKNLVDNGDFKTEIEIMRELGYDRIWDCGNVRCIWKAS